MPKSLGLTHSVRARFTPLGGRLRTLGEAPGGLACPISASQGRLGGQKPCRAEPAYLCLRQIRWTEQGHQLAQVVKGQELGGLRLSVLPHQG